MFDVKQELLDLNIELNEIVNPKKMSINEHHDLRVKVHEIIQFYFIAKQLSVEQL